MVIETNYISYLGSLKVPGVEILINVNDVSNMQLRGTLPADSFCVKSIAILRHL